LKTVYETIRFGGARSNTDRLGTIIAWLVSHHLIDLKFEHENSATISRLRMQDMTGPEFLTIVLDGEFSSTFLNPDGIKFVELYFGTGAYARDYSKVDQAIGDQWALYRAIAPVISSAYHNMNSRTGIRKKIGKILRFPAFSKKGS